MGRPKGTKRNKWVKAFTSDGLVLYFPSILEACAHYNIRYGALLEKLIEEGGLAPDGRTFFDYPTDWEMKELESRNQNEGLVLSTKSFRRLASDK